jgi:O-antigen/teichoic acid export membrane protein
MNIALFAISTAISLLLTPFLVKRVGVDAYGFITLANSFVSYVAVLTVALNSMSSRYISIAANSGDLYQANIYFNSVIIANVCMAAFLVIPLAEFVVHISSFLNVPSRLIMDVQITFSLAFFNLLLGLLGNAYSVAAFCKNRVDISANITIIGNVIRAIAMIILFSMFQPRIYFITLTMVVITVYSFVVNYHVTKNLMPELRASPRSSSWRAVKQLISSGIWNSSNQLGGILLNSIDVLLANIFIGAVVSGQLGVAKTMPNFIYSLLGMISAAFLPQMTILFAAKDNGRLVKLVKHGISITSMISMIPIGVLIVLGKEFFQLWVPSADPAFIQVLSVATLVPMAGGASINTVYNVFTVTNRLKVPALVLIATGVMNAGIAWALLKTTRIGVIAIPVTAGIFACIRYFTFTPMYAARCLNIKSREVYKSLFRGMAYLAVTCGVCWCLKKIIHIYNWPTLILCVGLGSIASIAIGAMLVLEKELRIRILHSIFSANAMRKVILGKSQAQ